MVTHFGNGTCTLKSKKYPIVWTGQYAQHVADNYYNNKPNHTLLHVEIQQALQRAKIFKKMSNTVHLALYEVSDGVVWVFFERHSNFVCITTGYKLSTTIDRAKKHINL